MDSHNLWGLAIYKKEHKDQQVLKDLLQFLKSQAPNKSVSFAYVEAQGSLLPNLTLWENLQLATGGNSWKEYIVNIPTEWKSLINLIRNPDCLTKDAENWEKFTLSLLKGLLATNQHLLIDMNEELLSPLMIQNFKTIFLAVAKDRKIILASAKEAVWLDCAYGLIQRQEYKFIVEMLDTESLKRHWAA